MKKELFKLNIKGTEYTLYIFKEDRGYYGLTDPKNKEIYIDVDRKSNEIIETLFHELTHAYLFECSLLPYYNDELLVGFLGMTIPLINKHYSNFIEKIKKGGF